jgi:hypothetical protein
VRVVVAPLRDFGPGERGFSWMPALLWRFDKDWKGVWREVPWVRERPSDYVRGHFRATTEPAQAAASTRIAPRSSTWWAWRCSCTRATTPTSTATAAPALLEAVDAEACEAITQSTATTFYRLEAIA